MANFQTRIRTDYRNIEGSIFDYRWDQLVTDGSGNASQWYNTGPANRPAYSGTHTGSNNSATMTDSTKYWRVNEHVGKRIINVTDGSVATVTANDNNTITGTLAGGAENDWDTSDVYSLGNYVLGDMVQTTLANRPTITTVGGYNVAEFDTSSSQTMIAPSSVAMEQELVSLAVEFFAGATTTAGQCVFDMGNFTVRARSTPGNVCSYEHNSTEVSGSTNMTDGVWFFHAESTSAMRVYKNNVSDFNGTFSPIDDAAATVAANLGAMVGGSQYLDGQIRHISAWNRTFSPKEIDFMHRTFSPVTDYASTTRSNMLIRAWTDDTDPIYAGVLSRVNPTPQSSQWFQVAEYATGGSATVQISCSVNNGLVVADTGLGGDLFDMTIEEHPTGAPPTVTRDSGWSSIFDVEIRSEGHYMFVVSRANGGSIILHMDAEEV